MHSKAAPNRCAAAVKLGAKGGAADLLVLRCIARQRAIPHAWSRSENAAMSAQYYLAPDVYFCLTQGHGVFLNLKRDKYSAVLLGNVAAPEANPDRKSAALSGDLANKLSVHADVLIKAGLVSADPAHGRPLAILESKAAQSHLLGLSDDRAFGMSDDDARVLKLTAGDLFDFLTASWKASRDLNVRHIADIVGRVRQRKAQGAQKPMDFAKTRRLVSIFKRLRPYYPRPYLCLYDSLALIEFLAARGVYPLWVFGVQAQPFGAHCWVEEEGLLFNDFTEYAGQFTPIMAI